MSPLDRKLLRDLWRIRTQAAAIGLVVAVGVLLLVMMDGLVNSLEGTRDAYYERYRFADVFAPVKRAPHTVLEKASEIDGVAAVEGRVAGLALIDVEDQAVPVQARAVSLPDFEAPRLNAVHLVDGRQIDPRRHDEILLLEGFADAHGLGPGDSIRATINGARRTLQIAGLAQSPEFIYSAAPGELIPDDARFAVVWMSQTALEAAYDVDGAINEVLVALDRGARPEPVQDALDRLLNPYGGLGAYDVADQFSNRFVTEEISGLRVSSRSVPPVFMGVAAFLLYIVVSRIVSSERTQIGLLKAFGYSSFEVTAHYLKMILIIAVAGALIGCALGVLSGQALAGYYQVYYKFPFLLFRVDPAAFIGGIVLSILAAAAGGMIVLRNIFRLTPAVAMRPPAPPDYSRSAQLSGRLAQWLDGPSRMVVRRLLRHPLRALFAAIGIAAGLGLSIAMLGVMASFDRTMDLNFGVIDRSDMTVTFIEPMGQETISTLRRHPGILRVEPFRDVPVILRNGTKTHRGSLTALEDSPELFRAMAADLAPIPMRDEGIILSRPLAEKLNIAPGEILTASVREGRRPDLRLPVAAVAEVLLGAPAYMERASLNRALKEPGRVSGAFVEIDTNQADEIYESLKRMPVVAGVGLQSDARQAFQEIMDEGAGAMRYIMSLIAAIITFGIVFNSARIAFSERQQDLASLRVLGFTRAETSFVLLGELAVITLLAIPLGIAIGLGLADLIAAGFSTDLYTIPGGVNPASIGLGTLAVLVASLVSALLVRRDINRLDLVGALKSRE